MVIPMRTEWSSGDRSDGVIWDTKVDSSVVYHAVTLQNQNTFNETGNQAEWGTLYFAQELVRNPFFHDPVGPILMRPDIL